MKKLFKGYSLIELLVVLTIIGIVVGISTFSLQGARQSTRDARRKSDFELIRSGLELYKSDCNSYPANSAFVFGSPLVGDGSSTRCPTTNTYIQQIPKDPQDPQRSFRYNRITTSTYELCAPLEGGSGSVACGGSSSCGTGVTCNYRVINP